MLHEQTEERKLTRADVDLIVKLLRERDGVADRLPGRLVDDYGSGFARSMRTRIGNIDAALHALGVDVTEERCQSAAKKA